MTLTDFKHIYFIGIGGIGMSALARWFMLHKKSVHGYDRTETALTKELVSLGAVIHYHDDVTKIPADFLPENTLVIWIPAIPPSHAELNFFKEKKYVMKKRSEVLGLISNHHRTIGVAGTHGKTTTSTMITHVLKTAALDMSAFLGGISANYQSNLVLNGVPEKKEAWVVAEADEFDRSFLRLFPTMAVVTSADPDHLDIYGTKENMHEAYRQFIKQIQPNGTLLIHESVSWLADSISSIQKMTYGREAGEWQCFNPSFQQNLFTFHIRHQGKVFENIALGVPGFHNMENATATFAIAMTMGISENKIREALASFRGVARRFEYVINRPDFVFVDDYAHHPKEIEAFLSSIKKLYPTKKITVIFQPHLFTRTRDFAKEFSASLSLADELLLMDIYPAREEPIPGVSSDMLMNDITSAVKIRCNHQDVLEKVRMQKPEVLATVGAGDIDKLVPIIQSKWNAV